MSERYYVNVSSLAGLSPGDYVVHPVIGGFKVARSWQPSYDREVKAETWDEAVDWLDEGNDPDQIDMRSANPYRIESQEAP